MSVRWGKPDEPVSFVCSYCSADILHDPGALRLFNKRGWGAVFCAGCSRTYFGLQSFDDDDPDWTGDFDVAVVDQPEHN